MEKKIRILYITNNMRISNGVSSVIINYLRKINREKFQIDFLLMDRQDGSYEKELLELGSKIFYMKNKFTFRNIRTLEKEIENFFENNKYDIVELHMPNLAFLFLKIAKKQNIQIRIVHSHSTIHSSNKIKNFLSIVLNINLNKYANKFFACSEKSGQYWYGRKVCKSTSYEVITNAVDIKNYKSDENVRDKIRKYYKIEKNIVIGFVGRISKEKNLKFFIKVMEKLIKENNKYIFLIIGDGKEEKNIKLKSRKIEKNVIFLGRRNDVAQLLNCMDLLVLPSKREGLPMVAVEAQLMNLPCYLSHTITKEVDIGNTKFIKLSKRKWFREILNVKKENKEIDFEKFDINIAVKKLENLYCTYYEEE